MRPLRQGLGALVTTAAAAASCATVWLLTGWIGADASAAVLATVIALSLGRRSFATRVEFARSAALLPLIGLGAAVVGWLLITAPAVGAALYVAGMSIPIWMRRLGPRAARLGALAALPLTAVLIVPVAPDPQVSAWLQLLLVIAAGAVAVIWVAVAREILRVLPGERDDFATEALATEASAPPARPAAPGARRRLPASTRMALQMAVALAAAFVAGSALFPDHTMWVVLTAFLVGAGNRGRADVLHKSVLRIVGALGGSVLAVGLTLVAPSASGFGAVALIFVMLFVGTWLRAYSYAFWALTVTLVLTLLQSLLGTAPALTAETGMLAERLAAIVTGALLGIAAAWFVLPVRSADVLRRRLSDMLIALGAALAPDSDGTRDRRARVADFRASVARVEQLAPAHRARRILPRRGRTLPIDCIEAAAELPGALDVRLAGARRPASTPPDAADRERLRDSLRDARRSLAAPIDLQRTRTALETLRAALEDAPVA